MNSACLSVEEQDTVELGRKDCISELPMPPTVEARAPSEMPMDGTRPE
jgi:hypothetical protein